MWIKKDADAEVQGELESDFQKLDTTDAYAVEITEAYLANSQQEGSKSVSVYISVKDEEGSVAKTRFTIMGKDGETFYMGKDGKGNAVKRQHIGLNQVNTAFKIALGKEIFDCEPSETEYKLWDNDAKTMVDAKGDGFPELIGKTIGICYQMKREIAGADTKEFGEIAHFFDNDTGLFAEEVESDRTKLEKWMKNKKEYIVKTIEIKKSSSFGKKQEPTADGETPKKKWGSK